MKFFYWLINWLQRLMFFDSPQIPWRWGNWEVESLFDNPHTHSLAIFLDTLEPQLLAQWYATVAPASAEARKAAIALDKLRQQKSEVAAKLADLEAQCPNKDDEKYSSKFNHDNNWEWLLTIGLSLMLFFGIAQTLHIDDVANLNSKKLPLFSLALVGAICLTAGAKLMVIRWVKATRSDEPTRSFYDDERYANPVAWWRRIFSGDSAVWLSLAVILLEIAFAGPGLIRLLPINLRKQLLIEVSAFIGAGIAALINVGLAWGTALEEIRSNKEYLTPRSEQQESTRRQAEVTKVAFNELTQEVKEQEQFVQHLTQLAQQEHDRWEATVKRIYASIRGKYC
ncbi:hypothetical protein G7B40_014460 [Aetokthonos hydrillicola Thurmond2011]|jgi:hypothetical protein|uniref:Uncharacterized protein n=2 Tax=Aetokthonos TaxID=1550243 RepID=A0AAP5MAL4_9CYAN|nr:hypothetical protein [Aetokthonos hydrillicola]MBW4589914.1 hypothetical protein [Aetokthonos hydrillicola CCALA 1050]MDR9895759.1 hypothetical protein [Aetokthonos hydrillicola Thurmond2011]